MDLLKDFQDPPSYYRSAPFWALNADLEDEELIRQIRAMRDGGMGGFFMHSRVGLITPYLSQEWMDRIRTCVEEARRLDMKAWLYDEDRYPSGPAGGIVPNQSKEYRNKALRMERIPADQYEPRENGLKVFAADGEESFEDVTGKTPDELKSLGRELVVFSMVYAADSPRMNKSCYIDTRNPDAVQAFIESTYEAYKKEFAGDFGGVVPGIFTDEPQGSTNGCPGPAVPWTNTFPEHFHEKKSYDILDRLPALFYDVPGYEKVRLDYWDLMTRLFGEVCMKRIYDWCEENNLELTGHYWEHEFPNPTHTGSAMPHYEYEQIPGIDMLFNQYELRRPNGGTMQFGNNMIVKEVASVAHQLGRPRVMSETYAGCGWDFRFDDQKRIGDWEYVLGVNFLCQHLSMYAMKGCRKHDYPPSFLTQSPWWKCYHTLGDYYGRLSYILSQGKFVTDLLVLHPSSSTWAGYTPLNPNEANEPLAAHFLRLTKDLCEMHRDYDLGDDILIEKHGRVEGDRFIIGEMSYRVVLIPSCSIIRSSTLDLLRQFVQAGGQVIAIEPTPTLLDGEASDAPCDFFSDDRVDLIPDDTDEIRVALSNVLPADVTVTDNEGRDIGSIYYQHRKLDGRHIYFFVNVDNERDYDAAITFPGGTMVEEWDAVTGRICSLEADVQDGRIALNRPFAPVESRLLVVGEAPTTEPPCPEAPKMETQIVEVHEIDDLSVARTDMNALALDYGWFQIEDEPWSDRTYILEAQHQACRHYGLYDNPHGAPQPWLQNENPKDLGPKAAVRVRQEFQSDFGPDGDRKIFLIVETPERFAISVNGTRIDYEDIGSWIDHSFKKIDITSLIQKGRNEILREAAPFAQDIEIDTCYLAGDFQVVERDGAFVLALEEDDLPGGDWSQQGYPFFPGGFAYSGTIDLVGVSEGERVLIQVDEWQGVAVAVAVNGKPAGTIGWKPYQLDVSKLVQEGRNEIVVEVIGSLRNLCGPHHLVEPTPGFIHPGSFYAPNNWKDDYDFVPSGLMGPVKVVRLK